MLRRAAFFPFLVLSASSLAVGQTGQGAPQKGPAPVIVSPGSDPSLPSPKQVEAQKATEPEKPHLKPVDLDKREALNDGTKMQLIRIMDAEFVHTRKYFPIGDKSIVIGTDGLVKPGDAVLYRMCQTTGAAARIGDRVQITNIVFHERSIYVEINGGPKKKTKWYQHIEISGMGGSTGGVDPNQAQPTGAALTVEFTKHVPEMTGEELHQILSPVLDFSVKTAAEVFADTLPPKIKEAVKKHEVLVGMNHDMVVMAKDRPPQKVREKDELGHEYEEWIYGQPPQDVVFVRFNGDEVVMVKIAKVGGELIVRTQKEVDIKDGVPTLTALKASDSPQDEKAADAQPQGPTKRPTLKRPDEQPEPDAQEAGRKASQAHPADEPQWGTSGNQQQQPVNTSTQPPQQPDQQQPPAEPELTKRPPL
jgi:hypothetical protein